MPDVSLSGISFTIKGNADAASDSIDKLIEKLGGLRGALKDSTNVATMSRSLGRLNKALEGLSKSDSTGAAKALGNIGRAIESLKGVSDVSKNLASFARAMNSLAENKDDRLSSLAVWLARIAEIDFSNLEKAGQGIREISDAAKKLSSGKASGAATQASQSVFSIMKKDLISVLPLMKKFSSYVRKGAGGILGYPFKSAYKSVAGYAKGLAGVVGGFKRIVGYRIIRSIIREITQAFSEGIQNLYGWSRLVGGQFAQSMDTIATSMRYFKNSIAAAVAPIINALAPAIDFLVDKIVALINVLNQLFAKLTGATYWTRAKKKATEFGDAVGGAGAAAQEALKYLAPFDELNVLPDQKDSGGGGGSGEDYSDMFENVTEFNEAIANFADAIKEKVQAGDWQGLGELLGNKVNDLVDSIDFAGMGAKVGRYINAWFTTKYWTLQTINFQNIGSKIAEFLNNALDEINFDTIGRTITQKFTILGDLIIGAVENINWHLVGESIGDFVRGAFDQMTEWLTGIDWEEFGTKVGQNIKNAIDGMNVNTVAQSIKGFMVAAFNAAKGLIGGLSVEFPILDVLFDWKDVSGETIAEKVIASLTTLTGAGVGFIIAGVPGAVVGSVVGLTIGLIADSMYFDHDGELSASEVAVGLKEVLIALTGGIIGFMLGGVGGALIGASVGLGISLLVSAVKFKSGDENSNSDWFEQLKLAIGALTGGILGFAVGGVPGAIIGATIGFALTATVESIKFEKNPGELVGESGRTGADYIIVDVIGLPSDDDWKTYGSNIWRWIVEGIGDIKQELYNVFIKPIVDTFDAFAEEHPVIAAALGLENGVHDILQLGWDAAESMWNIDVTATVTSVEDNLEDAEKTLDNFTAEVENQVDEVAPKSKILRDEIAVFGSVDTSELTEEQTKVDTTANFKTANKDNLEMKQRTFDARADFKYVAPIDTSTFTIDKRTFGARADFQYWTGESSLPWDKRTFGTKADFLYWTGGSSLPWDKRTFETKADFLYWTGASSLPWDKRTFETKADFQYWTGDSLPWDKKTFASKADFLYWTGQDALPWEKRTFGAKADFLYWTGQDALPWEKRTFGAKANFLYWLGESTLPWDKRTFTSKANFYYIIDSLSDAKKTFLTTSEFYYDTDSLSSSQKTFGTTADFGDSSDNLSKAKKTFSSYASMVDSWWSGDTPTMGVNAALYNPTWGNGTPTMSVNADLVYLSKGGSLYGGAWHGIPQYANGTPNAGSLFIAGEAGAEVVGHINGRTEVLNGSQIASVMYKAVSSAVEGLRFKISGANSNNSVAQGGYDEETMYRAMLRALNDSDVFPEEIDLDGDVVYRKMVQRNRNEKRRLGVNPMMAS